MDFFPLFSDRLYKAHTIKNYTRNTSKLADIHGMLADYIKDHSDYDIQDMRTHEFEFINSKGMGSKKVDIALLKDGEYLIELAKIQFLEGKARREMFDKNPPKYVLVFSERIKCLANGENTGGSSAICFCWYIFQKNCYLCAEIY